jgi:hypothetical protein
MCYLETVIPQNQLEERPFCWIHQQNLVQQFELFGIFRSKNSRYPTPIMVADIIGVGFPSELGFTVAGASIVGCFALRPCFSALMGRVSSVVWWLERWTQDKATTVRIRFEEVFFLLCGNFKFRLINFNFLPEGKVMGP